MSEQQLKAFLEQVKADAGLQERLNGADPYTVIAIAQENGFMESGADLEHPTAVLLESELESVAGGLLDGFPPLSHQYPTCKVTIVKNFC